MLQSLGLYTIADFYRMLTRAVTFFPPQNIAFVVMYGEWVKNWKILEVGLFSRGQVLSSSSIQGERERNS